MKIVVLEPLGIAQQKLSDILAKKLTDDVEIIYYDTRSEDREELIDRSKDADVVVLSNLPYPKQVMEHCPHLKAIMVAFTGVDHVDTTYCKEKGIVVCNSAGYSTVAVADLVFGMLLAQARNLLACDERTRNGGTKDGLIGFELAGKKFGIIGLGAIGQRVAFLAQAFGCEVYAYSRTKKDLSGIQEVALEELLATCDIISLHVPLNVETKHMIGEAELAKMKQDAILINTARGPVVDNHALAQALQNGQIGGACIDVFDQEPPLAENDVLLQAPHTLVTPHVAFASVQAMEKRAYIVAENLYAYLQGNPQNVVS